MRNNTMAAAHTSFTDRNQLLARMRRGEACDWDMIIIGGGITGAGVLREATRAGYRALLLEQRDFAWGTSSRSSKMVHGGLRYLGAGDFKLTRHSLTERERLLREAPGLVDRMGCYFTLRKGVFPGRRVFSMLLWLYDRLAGIKDNHYCDAEQMQKKFSGMAAQGLQGACYYTDAVTDDSRLVLRVLQESISAGGQALNYTRVDELLLEQGKVRGVLLSDGGEQLQLRAPVVVNATGAWADKLRGQVNAEKRVRPLRGSHLVLPKHCLPVSETLGLMHPVDKRSVFIFPWEGAIVVGTTDLDHSEELDSEASISEQEVDYLLQMLHNEFPQQAISRDDIIATYAGVRPVIGSEKSKDPSKERRDHAVWEDQGLVTASGGKLTTFRLIALDVLNAAAVHLPAAGSVKRNDVDERVFSMPTLSAAELLPDRSGWAQRLLGRYGAAAKPMLDAAEPGEDQRISGTQFSLAECRWALRHEAVQHLDDLLLRRTRLGLLLRQGGEQLFDALQRIFSDELDWNEQQWQAEVSRYRRIWQSHYSLPSAAAKVNKPTALAADVTHQLIPEGGPHE